VVELKLAKDEEKALKDASLLEKFNKLPPSHQREYHKWIEETKKPETRAGRIAKVIEMLANNQK
jgi:uncharacterized protein YdeI (YjbR/CyaY-like superfamily)